MDEFLTVDEVASRLKVNPQTVRNWVDRGELPAVRAGARRVRIRVEDFEARFGATRQQPAAEPAPAAQPVVSGEVVDALKGFSEAALRLALALERDRP